MKIIQMEVAKMLELGLIEPSRSPWSSPVTLVKKSDGGIRFCVDYRGLNKVTQSDQYPMPNMEAIIQQLQGAKFLSSMDMTSGYYQCGVAKDDIPKTAFTCSAGLFQFRVLPFGLKTAPATFNRLMAVVLKEVRNICAMAYLDDVIVYSTTYEQHLQDISKVLDLLQKAGLFVKLKKCQFCRINFKFLGNIISNGQLLIDPSKIESVQTFERPTNLKETQRFLGLTGWLRKHVKEYAHVSRPLSALTRGKNPKKEFKWTEECETAFLALKALLIKPGTALYLPDYKEEFIIECDASDHGIGGILRQEGPNGEIRVVEYVSRILKPSEISFTITEKELLAVLYSIKKFRAYISDKPFTVVTDHSALRWLMNNKDLTGCLTRWSLRLQEFDYMVVYRTGAKNVIADALSRGTTVESVSDSESDTDRMDLPTKKIIIMTITETEVNFTHLDPAEIQLEQIKETWIATMINKVKAADIKNPSRPNYKNFLLINNLLHYQKLKYPKGKKKPSPNPIKLVIPRKLIQKVLQEFHCDPSGGHFGKTKTSAKIKDRMFWHHMDQDISLFVQTCDICQLTKHPNKILKAPMQCNMVSRPFELLGIDCMGPYPTSKRQNKFLLVLVDHYTKWVEIFPMRNSNAKTIVAHVADTMGRYGIPERLVSDNGPQFVSKIYKELCQIWNVTNAYTSFYRPSSNHVERTNKIIKRLIRSYVDDNQEYWDRYIPQFLLAIRTTVNTTTNFTPAMLFLGRELNLPWDPVFKNKGTKNNNTDLEDYVQQQQLKNIEINEAARDNIFKHKQQQKKQYDKHTRERHFEVGDCVKVKTFAQSDKGKKFSSKLAKPWRGPCYVIKRLGDLAYQLSDENGRDIGKYNIEYLDNYCTREADNLDTTEDVKDLDPLAEAHVHDYYTRSKGRIAPQRNGQKDCP